MPANNKSCNSFSLKKKLKYTSTNITMPLKCQYVLRKHSYLLHQNAAALVKNYADITSATGNNFNQSMNAFYVRPA